MSIEKIIPYENNAKIHTKEQIEQIKNSILQFGNNDPIAIDENNTIIEGHGRYFALKELGYNDVDVIKLTHLDEEKKRAYILVHNKLTMNTDFDFNLLQEELDCLNIDMSQFGFDIDFDIEKETIYDKIKNNPIDSNLFDTFIVPPFSVFDTRSKLWIDRKNEWLSLGIKSELGRVDKLLFCDSLKNDSLPQTSIFNPVICEVCYNWFGVDNSVILDPFAGGSVRGIVAEKLGNSYIGIDLREEQIEANRINAEECNCDLSKINWITDNSQNVNNYVENESVDLIFTCPPYFDLEVYSDDKDDISNMDFEDFKNVYTDILKKCADKLKNNRFAIVVISDVRDKKGGYRDLTGITKDAFKSKGFCFYNDIILLNVVGSASLRARKAMVNRKTTRIHQNILVFYKGDTKEIQNNFKVLENIDYSLEEF
nr:MAG TPA: Putative modification methylase [Caudoviricetes sp.]